MANQNWKSHHSVLWAMTIAGVTILAAGCSSVQPSSQSDYPVLPKIVNVIEVPTSLADQVNTASLIIDATVLQRLPDEEAPLSIDPDSPEATIAAKQGTDGYSATFGAVSFKVNKVLKGTAADTVTMKISPFALGSVPDFQPGDRMILFLAPNINGDYFSVALQEAYWHVAADSKVYPAVATDQLKQYSGEGLGAFKSAINSIEHSPK